MALSPDTIDNFTLVTEDGRHGTHTVKRTIALAKRHGITLDRSDFTFDEDGYAELDGMSPGDWLAAMLAD
jgi:hypothetical protein